MALTEKKLCEIIHKNNSSPDQILNQTKTHQKHRTKNLKNLYSDLVNNMVSYTHPDSVVSVALNAPK